jgi:hypothetical protein
MPGPMPSSSLVPATDKPSREPRDHPNRDPSHVELHPVTRLLSAGEPQRGRQFPRSPRRPHSAC